MGQKHRQIDVYLLVLMIGALLGIPGAAQGQSNAEAFSGNTGLFNVYCTDNLDGTGICRPMNSKERLGCLILPAKQVICRSTQNRYVICVPYATSEWSCTPTPASQISPDIVNNPALRIPKREERHDPLRSPLTPTLYDTLDSGPANADELP